MVQNILFDLDETLLDVVDILEGLKEAGFPDENAYRVDSLEESTRLLHTLVKPTDTVLYENDLPDHYQEA